MEMQPYKGNELAPVAVTPPLPAECGTALVPNNTELVPGLPTVLWRAKAVAPGRCDCGGERLLYNDLLLAGLLKTKIKTSKYNWIDYGIHAHAHTV